MGHLQPDDPTIAKPSDHIMPFCEPLNNQNISIPRETYTRTVRPITIDQIMSLGQWITREQWDTVKQAKEVDEKVQAFDAIMKKIDDICPEKEIKCSVRDQPWMTSHIKTVIRQRKREFDQNGKSMRWKALQKKSKDLVKNSKANYAEKVVDRLKNSNKSSWYNTIKSLGLISG